MANTNETNSDTHGLLGAFSHPLPVEIVISTIVWLMCFFAVTGNILVFVVVLRDKQLRSNVANIYILNLASADLCVGLVSLTMNNIWRYSGNWPFLEAVCVFWIIVDYSACMQAGFAVTLISLDRYFMVAKYLEYRKYQSKKLAMSLIAATWTVSLVFFALPVLGNDLWVNDHTVDFDILCDVEVLYILSYNIAQIVIGFVVPAIILAYLNFKVYANILRRSKGLVRTVRLASSPLHAWDQAMQPSSKADAPAKAEPAAWDTRRTYRKHRKAAIRLAVIVGVFCFSWVPYYAVQFLFITQKIGFSWRLWNAVYYTVWVNSAINPFIYAATSRGIRRGFLEALCCWKGRLLRKIRPL